MISITKLRFFSYSFSCLMMGLLIWGIIYKRSQRETAFLYSIEFSGGIQVEASINKFDQKKEYSSEYIKELIDKNGIVGVSVRKLSDMVYVIRVPVNDERINSSEVVAVLKSLTEKEDFSFQVRDVSFVGPGVGKQLKIRAIAAIVLAFLLMFLYVWIRFKSWAFSLANSVSLFHDVLVIILMILWFDYEFSLEIIGAILFILGYSINDTIVIFSRIRENIASYKHNMTNDVLSNIINKSVKETLRRTILTSFFTTLVVFPLFLFGGVNLEPLSAAVLLGIIFGTYSSIGIASPVLYDCLKE